jgi:molybdopterin synthase catalytic subunit
MVHEHVRNCRGDVAKRDAYTAAYLNLFRQIALQAAERNETDFVVVVHRRGPFEDHEGGPYYELEARINGEAETKES